MPTSRSRKSSPQYSHSGRQSSSSSSSTMSDRHALRDSIPKPSLDFISAFYPSNIIIFFLHIYYAIVQKITIAVFKPTPPPTAEHPKHPFGRIAVIGAGLTGVSSAAHCIAHNFDVVIFDKNPKVGGIWSQVNRTSGLQINSLVYRFHPGVLWKEGFPKRDEILGEITRIWKEYQLEPRSRFSTVVTKVSRAPSPPSTDPREGGHARWYVHTDKSDDPEGPFDAIIVTIGTCGEPMKNMHFDGEDEFTKAGGWLVHSSELDRLEGQGSDDGEDKGKNKEQDSEEPEVEDHRDGRSYKDVVLDGMKTEDEGSDGGSDKEEAKKEQGPHQESEGEQEPESKKRGAFSAGGKQVVIIGSGASGVEAAEWAVEKGAKGVWVMARDDKWILPRNVVIDTTLSAQPFGRQTPFSFVPEYLIKKFHYRDLADLAPQNTGIFESTPVINSTFLQHIRDGRIHYIRGDTKRFTSNAVIVNERSVKSKPGDEGEEKEFEADVVILATGFKRPSSDFLEKDLFPEGFDRPNLYLQNFCTEDWSVLMTNSSYMNAIGTVGHFHIGIYTRILLTLLLDKNARPLPDDMKLWVNLLRFLKRGAKGGALSFFTYMELTIWLISFHLFRPDRLKWMLFIMQGWGVTWHGKHLGEGVVSEETEKAEKIEKEF